MFDFANMKMLQKGVFVYFLMRKLFQKRVFFFNFVNLKTLQKRAFSFFKSERRFKKAVSML